MDSSPAYPFSTRDLIHIGFQRLDEARAAFDVLNQYGVSAERMPVIADALASALAPDTALDNLVGIIESLPAHDDDLRAILEDDTAARKLIAVLGSSDKLGKLMRTRPDLIRAAALDPCRSCDYNHAQRVAKLLDAVQAVSLELGDAQSEDQTHLAYQATLPLAEATDRLRAAYRRQLAAIIAVDATAEHPDDIQPRISKALSDLADAALEAALAIARHETPDSARCRFSIIGMGKLGAQELNYVSDVDLIYVVEPIDSDTTTTMLTRIGTRLGTMLQRV
ncbi:MAG: bifunctional glutamine-synthetase adenylyltransferase/deadenyltransferase, partial [Bifidobacterium sp.]|nr:bifunctional glutamine-synthetase adenylyltransferase/deadenyltransferase [Bifidobacterium sp.]